MDGKPAIDGVKILDFSWIIAGPLTTKILGEYGATVIKVESMLRPDAIRPYLPYGGGIPGVDRSAVFSNLNTSKYHLRLNLNNERGLDVARRLADVADVVIENFTAGTMERWGLDYDSLVKTNPDVIMVRASLQGQEGPFAKQGGIGLLMQGLAGLTLLAGWPDRAPVGPPLPYTDYVAPWLAIASIMGALAYRRKTGRGQLIDISQMEAAEWLVAPAIVDYAASNRIFHPMGNRHAYAVPHGAYRCRGEDRWVAIAVFTDGEWDSFCRTVNRQWTNDARFATFVDRKRHEDELDQLIEAWTVERTPEETMQVLQSAGVGCGVVQDGEDLHNDPQLKHRHHFNVLDHPEIGKHAISSAGFRLSETPARTFRAPLAGEHNEWLCKEILNMSDEEFVELLTGGAFE